MPIAPFRVDECWFIEIIREIKTAQTAEDTADLVIHRTLLGVRDGLVELR